MRQDRTNRYVRSILKRTGEANLSKAVEKTVDQYRAAGESLEQAAYRLGIARITSKPMPFDGGIYESGNELEIRLNSLSPLKRRRFTLAHEIGHLILEEHVRNTRNCTDDSGLERTCDLMAAELLMPAGEVRRYAGSLEGQTPANLQAIATHFEVSLHATALRLHKDLQIWKKSIGMWERKREARELWFVGHRPWTSSRQDFHAFVRAQRSESSVTAREFCWKGAGLQAVSLELMNLGNYRLLGTVSEGISPKLAAPEPASM